MTAVSLALQRSIYQVLTGSSDLTALLGGARVYSTAPAAAQFPYITLGQTVNLDWSTGSENGKEQSLTLHVWSRADSAAQVLEIIEAVRTVLHNKPPSFEGHYLINLRHEFSEARIDPDGEIMHGIVRYRAATEPAQAVAA